MSEKLTTITAGELLDAQLLPQSQIVNDFLPTGTYLLAGSPKIGKSFLMTQLCWCISEGVSFWGHDTRQGDVLYLALEDTNIRLQERLSRMFGVDWQGAQLHLAFRANWQGNDLVTQLQEFVFEHPDTRLIVIDTLQRIRPTDGGRYSYSNDYKDITPFKSFSDSHDLALILVHHTRKDTDSANPFDQISGTNGLLGAADGAFVLHRERDEVLLDFTGRDLPPQRYILRFAKSSCLWELVRVQQSLFEKEPVPLLDWIDAMLHDHWYGTAEDLLAEINRLAPENGLKANVLSRQLNRLTARLEDEKRIRYRKMQRTSSKRWITIERISSE